jgi:hypothetical protein
VFIINVRTTHVIRKHGEFKRVVNITQTPKMVKFFSIKSGATRFSRNESSHRIRCFIGGFLVEPILGVVKFLNTPITEKSTYIIFFSKIMVKNLPDQSNT